MLGMITGLFKTKEAKTKTKLQKSVIKEVTIKQAVKEPYYHEIVDNEVRIYSRKEGLVTTVKSEKPLEKAVELLAKYNGGNT